MQDTADSYPNESLQSSKSNHDSYSKLPLPKSTSQHLSASAHLYPIDETEDFHDPFSDLNLFLSKKIKVEVEKHGSSKQWSHKIQQDLLAGILPEFKIKFPKYRIGISAIRKVWEKVSYYYGKIQAHQEAIQSNGKLNLAFMIKENLRGYPFANTAQLPHYNTAHQLAVKMSECIAALEGTRPRLDRLTKIIWAAQKHLITDLPSQKSKNAYEEYDHIDKLVIKLVLETTAHQPQLAQAQLEELVRNKLHHIYKISKHTPSEVLYHHLATLLAEHLYPTLSLHHLLSSKEKQKLTLFIQKQMEFTQLQSGISEESARVETSQRILALYPLALSIPTTLTEEEIQAATHYVYSKINGRSTPTCPKLPQSLLSFIHAELHFLKRKNEHLNYAKILSMITSTLMTAQNLPMWREEYTDELEIFIWHLYQEKKPFAHPERALFEQEIENFLIDCPKHSFKNTLYQMLGFFKKIEQSFSKNSKEEELALWEEVDHKIYLWTIQNDMLCRWIHFDPNLTLLKIIRSLWVSNNHHESKVNHEQFIQEVLTTFVKTTPCKHLSTELLRTRITLLYKYFWYHDLSAPEEASIDRFIKWHLQEIRQQHSKAADQRALIEHRVSKLLPLTPLSRKQLEKIA